jgi:hypothetical protein
VRNIGLTFPGVEPSTAYGSPVLRVHGKILAGIAVNRSAEPGSLLLCLDFNDRAELLAADPDVYFAAPARHGIESSALPNVRAATAQSCTISTTQSRASALCVCLIGNGLDLRNR